MVPQRGASRSRGCRPDPRRCGQHEGRDGSRAPKRPAIPRLPLGGLAPPVSDRRVDQATARGRDHSTNRLASLRSESAASRAPPRLGTLQPLMSHADSDRQTGELERRRHSHEDPVGKRSRPSSAIFRDLCGRAYAPTARITGKATVAGIHGRHQREARGKRRDHLIAAYTRSAEAGCPTPWSPRWGP